MRNSLLNIVKIQTGRSGVKGRGASKRVENVVKEKSFKFPKKLFYTMLSCALLVLLVINLFGLYEKVNGQKIEHIVIEGSLDYVSEEDVQYSVFQFINMSLVAIKLDEMKLVLEENPWIKTVEVKREWPNTLIVSVVEEMAIARWNDLSLLSQEGEIFTPPSNLNLFELPHLSGPAGTEKVVMEQYQKFNELLYPHGLRIKGLNLNNREAWFVELLSGARINIGNEDVLKRMRRFVDSINSVILENINDIDSIDLRYENGIAISHKKEISGEVVSL